MIMITIDVLLCYSYVMLSLVGPLLWFIEFESHMGAGRSESGRSQLENTEDPAFMFSPVRKLLQRLACIYPLVMTNIAMV